MQQGIPVVTIEQIAEESFPYFGGGSYFQTTAYDTLLFISDSETYDLFHKFELFGRKILWVNQVNQDAQGEVKTVMARTIFPCSEADFDGHIVAHRFASLLCYVTHGTFINPRLWVGYSRPIPTTNQPSEKYLGTRYSHEDIDMLIRRLEVHSFTEKRWAALAHYRQASLAQTPYYQVLSYWKILELRFHNNARQLNGFIDHCYSERPDNFHYVGEFNGAASQKLRDIRNASAHFMRSGDTGIQDPDNPDIYNEVEKGIFILKRLSEKLIEESSGW